MEPSRIRQSSVVADVDPDTFLGAKYAANSARLEIEFWYPRGVDYEYYTIQWGETGRNLGLGWHQDSTHSTLGECHVQIDVDGTTVDRVSANFLDTHPLNVLEARLEQMRQLIPALSWSSGTPAFPSGGIPSP